MKFTTGHFMLLLLCIPLQTLGQRLEPPRQYLPGDDDDDDEPDKLSHLVVQGDVGEDEDNSTYTSGGLFVGASCELHCNPRLLHVYCNLVTKKCECEKKFPVHLNPYTGCSKPKILGEQCYYKETCQFADQHSSCIQIHHNAICQCEPGYHFVAIQKPSKRVFCAEDLVAMTTDFSTFAGVLSGIAILSGLICFVLHLFNENLYGSRRRRHRFANANVPPPIMFSNDGGSRRASSASLHSVGSIRSYSAQRYDREREHKEEREMQKRMNKLSSISNNSSRDRVAPTPSPLSTDDLLPTVEEDKQVPPLATREDSTTSFPENIPSTSKQFL